MGFGFGLREGVNILGGRGGGGSSRTIWGVFFGVLAFFPFLSRSYPDGVRVC